jgi:hypothetical protein
MNSHLPIAVRAAAAALAVLATTATLNAMISIAEPQHSQLVAANAARQATQVAPASRHAVVVAAASMSQRRH